MADETTTAALPDDRDVAIKELWSRVFGGGDASVDSDRKAEDARPESVVTRFGQIEHRLDRIEDRLGHIDDRLGQIETKFAVIETKMSLFETSANRLDASIVRLQENARTDFRLVFGAIFATTLGLAGMMAKGFHWI